MDKKTAYNFGFDCGYNGATKANCHFTIFTSPELTKEWERGKRIGEAKIIEDNEASLSPCCKKPVKTTGDPTEIEFHCSKCKTILDITGTGFKLPKKKALFKK